MSVLERTRELLLQKALTPAPFEKLAAIAAPKTRPIARRTTSRMAKPLREAICEQLAPRGITISQAAELGAALHELFECDLRRRTARLEQPNRQLRQVIDCFQRALAQLNFGVAAWDGHGVVTFVTDRGNLLSPYLRVHNLRRWYAIVSGPSRSH